jgi:hypothetical protein
VGGAKTVKELLERKPGGEIKKGSHTLTCLDGVYSELRSMDVKRWRTGTLNRTEWASAVK